MTFSRWRQQLRLLHAMQRLASGEKVTAAALDAGYNSTSAFISMFGKQLGKAAANSRFRFSRQPTAGDMERKPVPGKPYEPVDGRLPAAFAAFQLVDLSPVMVDRDANRQPLAIAMLEPH